MDNLHKVLLSPLCRPVSEGNVAEKDNKKEEYSFDFPWVRKNLSFRLRKVMSAQLHQSNPWPLASHWLQCKWKNMGHLLHWHALTPSWHTLTPSDTHLGWGKHLKWFLIRPLLTGLKHILPRSFIFKQGPVLLCICKGSLSWTLFSLRTSFHMRSSL